MKKRALVHVLLICLLISNLGFSYAYWASFISGDQDLSNGTVTIGSWPYEYVASLFTDFEDVSKGGYASGEIETYGHTWLLDDALIGTLSSDLKNDSKSIRLRNGVLETRFSVAQLESIEFYIGSYGTDTPVAITLELSDDQATWHHYLSIAVTTSFIKQTIVFDESQVLALGLTLSDELYMRFKSTSSQRANIDDVDIKYNDEYIVVLEDYTTGFESVDGFVADTTYNNSTIKYEGAAGKQWGFYYGTPSSTDEISGLQSAQMRWYTSAPANLGYMFSDFDTFGVQSMTFLASSTNSLNVLVSISTDGGITWIEEVLYNLTTSATEYTYTVDSAYTSQNLRFKLEIDFVTAPNGTSRLFIDDLSMFTS